jgi:type I restriction enzyme S subunit
MSDDLIFKFNINTICERGIVSTLYPVFSAKEDKIIPFFLQTILNEGQEFKSFAISQKQGGSRTYMYFSKLKELQITIPAKPEQQKIASCLFSLDEVIAAHSKKLALLKDYKKGLMQNLFPQEGEKVPKYRFKEFVNDGEWDVKSIGEIFNSFSGGTPNTSERNYYGTNIPFIRSAEINKEETALFLTKEGLKNSSAKLVSKGDLLIALYGANSGDSAISKINGAINQAILCLQSEYSNAYTYNFLTLKKDWIVSRFIQGGQGNLSGDIVKSISIPFPSSKEQQKIASCLSALDDLVTVQTEIIEQLKLHKKGLMQSLFPQMND